MITQFLDVNALLAVMRVNRRFHRIALPVLWKESLSPPPPPLPLFIGERG